LTIDDHCPGVGEPERRSNWQRSYKNESMKGTPVKLATVVMALFAIVLPAAAESATMGWQAVSSTPGYATRPLMTGPTARNKTPEKKGAFKGEFLSSWGCQIAAIHKLSPDEAGSLQTMKVSFTILPVEKPEIVETNGIKQTKVLFETESLSFEPGECFVLVFKTKVGSPEKEHTDICVLHITKLFIPS
jgi:hypothetical protein